MVSRICMHLVEKIKKEAIVWLYDIIDIIHIITLFTGPKGGNFEPEEKHFRIGAYDFELTINVPAMDI